MPDMNVFSVPGMSCGHCVQTITSALKHVDGRASVDINLEAKTVRVESTKPLEVLVKAISAAGYESSVVGP
jgi:copper chaperone